MSSHNSGQVCLCLLFPSFCAKLRTNPNLSYLVIRIWNGSNLIPSVCMYAAGCGLNFANMTSTVFLPEQYMLKNLYYHTASPARPDRTAPAAVFEISRVGGVWCALGPAEICLRGCWCRWKCQYKIVDSKAQLRDFWPTAARQRRLMKPSRS